MAKILAISPPNDGHVMLVSSALSYLGHDVSIFGLQEFPYRDEHAIWIGHHGIRFTSTANHFDSEVSAFDAVWFRRLSVPPHEGTKCDPRDARFVERALSVYPVNLYALLSSAMPCARGSRWVNPIPNAYIAENKLLQLVHAQEVGFTIPNTLISNKPEAISRFAEEVGKVACKGIVPGDAHVKDGQLYVPYTAILPDLSTIPDPSIRLVPAIYQGYLDKDYEVRVVFMGTKSFAVRINSQADPATRIDWKVRPGKWKFQPYELPESVQQLCIAFLRTWSLEFGCFDLVRQPDGQYVFLELNQAGQFLFMEDACPDIKMLDAFCHFLAHRQLDGWNSYRATLSLAQIRSRTEIRSGEANS